jgi:2,4-dienoyl-CoA reductase (NADPH2)
LNLARIVPGKGEFNELLRYYRARLTHLGIEPRLGVRADADTLAGADFDDIVVATGVRPRVPAIDGIDHPMVLSYVDVLAGRAAVGRQVAIIGAGGIGFDVAAFLLCDPQAALSSERFLAAWQVDPATRAGGLSALGVAQPPPAHEVTLLQRRPGKPGAELGKTTGWILKSKLREAGLDMLSGVQYTAIDDAGLHYRLDGAPRLLAVDNVILCAGQQSERTLFDTLQARGLRAHAIGGAQLATELDAARAIEQATQLALGI